MPSVAQVIGAERAEAVGEPRADEADAQRHEPEHQEHEAHVLESDVLGVQRDERAEPDEATDPKEEDRAGDERGTREEAAARGRRFRRADVGAPQAEQRREYEEAGGGEPHRVVAARVECHLAQDGPERGARVERHGEVRHPLTPSRLRCEVGDRRRDADPERSLPDALDHARSDEQRHAVDREVHGRRERGDQRAAQDQDPAARTVADPACDRTERHRAEPEGAERDPDRDVTPAERAFDEAREHRHDHAERGEVEETGADQREERRREQAFFAGTSRAVEPMTSSARDEVGPQRLDHAADAVLPRRRWSGTRGR